MTSKGESNDSASTSKSTTKCKSNKTKISDQVATICQDIKASNSLLLEQMKTEHTAKMQRMDRYLELFAKQVDAQKPTPAEPVNLSRKKDN